MKIKNGFTLHQIGDEHIIMHNGTGNVDFSNIISLNPTATRLWQHVKGKDFNADTLTDFLTENYEVWCCWSMSQRRDLFPKRSRCY